MFMDIASGPIEQCWNGAGKGRSGTIAVPGVLLSDRDREKRYHCYAGRTAMEPVKGEAVPLLCRAYCYGTG
ncbi:hypothetical protein B4102_2354 [Heyndrickxia sporothermodurans]|uniref:Uncharacterized protein n=1 Tax=Heyndrickxia sporothermodurans TaxID=46224 RepID=A0A150LCW7_9BACI|nr:hypothetical protein B4102_2354 [Heyndrickxia sporothermodurans]